MPCFNPIGLGLTKDQGQAAIMTQKIVSRSKNAMFIDKIRASAILLPVGSMFPGIPESLDHCVRDVLVTLRRELSRGPVRWYGRTDSNGPVGQFACLVVPPPLEW